MGNKIDEHYAALELSWALDVVNDPPLAREEIERLFAPLLA